MNATTNATMNDTTVAYEPPTIPADDAIRAEMAREQAAQQSAVHQEAYRAGLAAAEAEVAAAIESYDARRRELEARCHRLDGLLAALEDAVARTATIETATLRDLEREALQLATGLAEQIVGHELRLSPDQLADAFDRAVRLLPDRGDLVVRVNPQDRATTDETVSSRIESTRGVTIIGDPAVEPGGCTVSVGALQIDAQIAPAIERLRSMLDA